MKEIETKKTRTHEIRDGKIVAIRVDEGENGSGNFVKVITEETIKEQDVNDVLETHCITALANVDKEISKSEEKIKELEVKVADFIASEDYIKFKEFVDSEETEKQFENMNLEKDLNSTKKYLEHQLKERSNILSWKEQFENIKRDISK